MPQTTIYEDVALHACSDPKCNCMKLRFSHFVKTIDDPNKDCDGVQASIEFDEIPSLAAALMQHYKDRGGKTQ